MSFISKVSSTYYSGPIVQGYCHVYAYGLGASFSIITMGAFFFIMTNTGNMDLDLVVTLD